MNIRHLLRILGPGLLYAGAAIGVSHLVQSTRAGASYGFSLVWVLILVNALKYPFFEFGTRYAAVTGESLIDGYRKMGKWAIVAFAILTLLTMFAIQAAVTIVTAGLTGNILHINLNPGWISAILLISTVVILMIGRYNLLDKLIKFVIVILAISTVFAVAGALSKGVHAGSNWSGEFSWYNSTDIFFLIAFVGWMPAPIDVAVWSSLWSVAKQRNLHYKPSLRDSLLDFRIGYIGTAIMACCFLSLGALVLHGSGIELSSNGTVFAGQLIEMYTESIGKWAYYIIAAAALTTMFSTTLTCIDAYPRVLMPTTEILFPRLTSQIGNRNYFYWFWILILSTGTIITLLFFATSMRFMVDLATTLSFLTAPVLAFMNYRVVTAKSMPLQGRLSKGLKIYAWIGIVFLTGFTLFYIITYFAS
ncbi:MAG: Nramp family divalent metal transporter [Bacteroidetes bacterium]|nr:Nramp family divalent metal transporter [Bacteroidota bacterium]